MIEKSKQLEEENRQKLVETRSQQYAKIADKTKRWKAKDPFLEKGGLLGDLSSVETSLMETSEDTILDGGKLDSKKSKNWESVDILTEDSSIPEEHTSMYADAEPQPKKLPARLATRLGTPKRRSRSPISRRKRSWSRDRNRRRTRSRSRSRGRDRSRRNFTPEKRRRSRTPIRRSRDRKSSPFRPSKYRGRSKSRERWRRSPRKSPEKPRVLKYETKKSYDSTRPDFSRPKTPKVQIKSEVGAKPPSSHPPVPSNQAHQHRPPYAYHYPPYPYCPPPPPPNYSKYPAPPKSGHSKDKNISKNATTEYPHPPPPYPYYYYPPPGYPPYHWPYPPPVSARPSSDVKKLTDGYWECFGF